MIVRKLTGVIIAPFALVLSLHADEWHLKGEKELIYELSLSSVDKGEVQLAFGQFTKVMGALLPILYGRESSDIGKCLRESSLIDENVATVSLSLDVLTIPSAFMVYLESKRRTFTVKPYVENEALSLNINVTSSNALVSCNGNLSFILSYEFDGEELRETSRLRLAAE